MFNPLSRKQRIVFVDGNGMIMNKSSHEIRSLLQNDVLVIARLHTANDTIYALPTYYDEENYVMWFSFDNGLNNLHQIVGVDANAEIVYYTGD